MRSAIKKLAWGALGYSRNSQMKVASYAAVGVAVAYVLLFAAVAFTLGSQGRTLEDFIVGPGGDQWEYAELGRSLVHNGTFSLTFVDEPQPEFFRTPGYPMFAALVFFFSNSLTILILFQIMLVAATVFFMVRLGEVLWSTWAGAAAGVLYAIDPTTVLATLATLSDILFTFFVVLCVWIITTRAPGYVSAAALGIAGGFLTLVRPLGLYVLPLFLVWYLFFCWRQKLEARVLVLHTLLLIAGAATMLLPWAMRNERVGGHFALSTAGPYNMLFYNLVEFKSSQTGDSKETVEAQFKAKVGSTDGGALRTFVHADQISALAHEELWSQPISYGIFHIFKSTPYFFMSSIEQAARILHQKEVFSGAEASDVNVTNLLLTGRYFSALKALTANPWGLLERMAWLAVFLCALLSAVVVRGKAQVVCIAMLLLAFGFALLTGPVAFPRYRLPAEPLLFLAASIGIAALYTTLSRDRTKV